MENPIVPGLPGRWIVVLGRVCTEHTRRTWRSKVVAVGLLLSCTQVAWSESGRGLNRMLFLAGCWVRGLNGSYCETSHSRADFLLDISISWVFHGVLPLRILLHIRTLLHSFTRLPCLQDRCFERKKKSVHILWKSTHPYHTPPYFARFTYCLSRVYTYYILYPSTPAQQYLFTPSRRRIHPPRFNMSTVTASHSPSRVPSRSSSPRLSAASVRRPKMMRSTATAPSLVTSYASRNDLAAQQTSRAAMILNRFASHGESMSQQSLRRSLSSARRSASPKQHHLSGHEVSNDEVFPKDGESADSGYCG